MAPILPEKLLLSLSQQWPCRELQIKQLASLLSPAVPSPSTLVVHGISATCKSTITQAVLSSLDVPHAIVRCAECITGRHLLTKILWATLEAFGKTAEWERFGKGKCEHVSTLVVLLGEVLASTTTPEGRRAEKFVLVLDGIDRQREAPPTLLSALARLGEVIPSLCVVLILSSTPRPLFLQSAGVPHISFPPYTRKEAITIITASGPPSVDGLPTDIASKLYPHFVSTVYDSLVGPTAGTIPSFRSICERLWPPFVTPVVNERNKEWDFSRLLVRNRGLFRQQGEAVLVHRIVPEESTTSTTLTNDNTSSTTTPTPASSSPLPSLPYFPTLVLTSAYLASHTPPRLDTIFFSKFSSSSLSARNKRSHHRRRLKLLSQAQAAEDRLASEADPSSSPTKKKGKRQKTRITKSTLESAFATTTAGGPPLERTPVHREPRPSSPPARSPSNASSRSTAPSTRTRPRTPSAPRPSRIRFTRSSRLSGD
ncbi:hypothetical protein VTN00DRAFT_3127 [Thermoascus crustaceus]|uniref:uncharacterized protein n=1 Tax=Thermoascus crustaceus TaxID=5088 RepID=UPI0037430EBB